MTIPTRTPRYLTLAALTAAALLGGTPLQAEQLTVPPPGELELVVVQPAPRRGAIQPSEMLQRRPTAVYAAPLQLTQTVDQPLPSPTRPRGPGADFQPIGALTANASIGSSAADADVSSSDRPLNPLEPPELIAMAGAEPGPGCASWGSLPSTSIHQPLYFEDANLERYGTTRYPRLQPLCSAAHFGFSAATLPYQMVQQRPQQEYRYDQPFEAGRYGYRQPSRPPLDRRAAAVQAAMIVGLVFVFP
jgi:hypothetical protein